jgi:hypothetical protein
MSDERQRFVHWWYVPTAIAGVVIVVLTAVTILFVTREHPDAKPVEDVIAEFHSTTIGPDTATTTTDPGVGTTSAPGERLAPARPPEGVYVMEGEGREAISFPPVSQDDGATIPATITHRPGGCWTFMLFYNEAHWQDWELCPDGDDLVETQGHTFQRWDFGLTTVENRSTFVCVPPTPFLVRHAEGGSAWDRSCDGTNDTVEGTTTSAGTLTYVGVESLSISGESLEALHFNRHNTLSGAQTGEDDTDLWFSMIDGMPLRGERDVLVESDSPVGEVTYTEQGWWQLTSIIPAG